MIEILVIRRAGVHGYIVQTIPDGRDQSDNGFQLGTYVTEHGPYLTRRGARKVARQLERDYARLDELDTIVERYGGDT